MSHQTGFTVCSNKNKTAPPKIIFKCYEEAETMMVNTLLLFVIYLIVVSCEKGFDQYEYSISDDSAQCLADAGFSFVVARGYHALYEIDPSGCDTVISAYNSGFKTRDMYIYPCKYIGIWYIYRKKIENKDQHSHFLFSFCII